MDDLLPSKLHKSINDVLENLHRCLLWYTLVLIYELL